MKHLVFIISSFFSIISLQAQVVHRILGQPLLTNLIGTNPVRRVGNEIGTKVKALSDGSVIIAGHRAVLNGSGHIDTSALVIVKLDAADNIVWQQSFGVFYGFDVITDMIISTINEEEHVTIIGNMSTSTHNRILPGLPFVLHINTTTGASGGLTMDFQSTGQEYRGICQLDNGDLVVVGVRNANAGSAANSLVTVIDNVTLGVNYHEMVAYNSINNQSDGYYDVVTAANGNDVLIIGVVRDPLITNRVVFNMTITYFIPATGSVLWTKVYRPNYLGDQGDDYRTIIPQDAWLVDNGTPEGELLISSSLTDIANASTVLHSITSAYAGVNSALFYAHTKVIRNINSSTGNAHKYCNSISMYPLSNEQIFVAENPGPSSFSAEVQGLSLNDSHDAWLSEIVSLSSGSVNFSRSISVDGIQSVLDMDYKDGKLYMVGYNRKIGNESGSIGGEAIGGLDIFYSKVVAPVDMSFEDIQHCPHPELQISVEIVDGDYYELPIAISQVQAVPYFYVGFDPYLSNWDLCNGQAGSKRGKSLNSYDVNIGKDIDIYPNPATNELNIDLTNVDGKYEFVLADVTGKVVAENSGTGGNIVKLSLPVLSTGVYIATVRANQIVHTEKVVIK